MRAKNPQLRLPDAAASIPRAQELKAVPKGYLMDASRRRFKDRQHDLEWLIASLSFVSLIRRKMMAPGWRSWSRLADRTDPADARDQSTSLTRSKR